MTAQQREAILVQAEAIPISQHLVAEYRGRVATLASRQTASEDRAEVLNRLYQFFSRHYQDGDFIVERRYGRDGARYIRSTGEDTEFHWATEDMYYIKSGDIFTDFPGAPEQRPAPALHGRAGGPASHPRRPQTQ